MRLKWLISVAAVMTSVMVGADLAAQEAPARRTRAGKQRRARRRRRPRWIQSSAVVDDDRCVSRRRHRASEIGWPRGRAAWFQIQQHAGRDDELRDHLPRHRRVAEGQHGDVLHWIVWNIPASWGGIPRRVCGRAPSWAGASTNREPVLRSWRAGGSALSPLCVRGLHAECESQSAGDSGTRGAAEGDGRKNHRQAGASWSLSQPEARRCGTLGFL